MHKNSWQHWIRNAAILLSQSSLMSGRLKSEYSRKTLSHWCDLSLFLLFNSLNTCKTGRFENANLIKSVSSVKIRSGLPEKRQKVHKFDRFTKGAVISLAVLTHGAANETEPGLKHSRSATLCLLWVLVPAKILLTASQVMSPDRFWSALTMALRWWKTVLSVSHPATSAVPCHVNMQAEADQPDWRK